MRGPRTILGALGVYLLVSFLYFGLSVAAHPHAYTIGAEYDPYLLTWSLAWWPHAILHGINPFVPHDIWAPYGFNVTWATTVPSIALALAPLTLLAGPTISYTVAALLAPALAAWTAFLLSRHVTRSFWPSLAAGYLFGFSSYMLGQEQAHLQVSTVFALPLIALLVLRFVEGTLSTRRLVIFVAALLAFEFSISVEVAFTLTLALVVSLTLGYAFAPKRRGRIRAVLMPLAGAYAVAGVIVSPLLYYSLSSFESASHGHPDRFPADLVNFVIPTGLVALSGHWASMVSAHWLGNTAENGAYLGVPLLVVLAWFTILEWRRPAAKILLSGFAIAVVASLGFGLYFDGRRLAPAPWALVRHVPLFNSALPARFALYVSLAATMMAAIWGSSQRISPLVRGLLLGAAIVTLAPALTHEPWKLRVDEPQFFASGGAQKTCIRRGDNVLVLPYFNAALHWQQADGFRYRLAAPLFANEPPPALRHDKVVEAIIAERAPPGGGTALLRFARASGIDAIVLDPARPDPWRSLLSKEVRPVEIEGVLLYPLRPAPASCGQPRKGHVRRKM